MEDIHIFQHVNHHRDSLCIKTAHAGHCLAAKSRSGQGYQFVFAR